MSPHWGKYTWANDDNSRCTGDNCSTHQLTAATHHMQWHQCLHHRLLNAYFASGGTSKQIFFYHNSTRKLRMFLAEVTTQVRDDSHLYLAAPMSEISSYCVKAPVRCSSRVLMMIRLSRCGGTPGSMFKRCRWALLQATSFRILGWRFFLISRIIIDWVLLSVGSFRSLTSPSGMT